VRYDHDDETDEGDLLRQLCSGCLGDAMYSGIRYLTIASAKGL